MTFLFRSRPILTGLSSRYQQKLQKHIGRNYLFLVVTCFSSTALLMLTYLAGFNLFRARSGCNELEMVYSDIYSQFSDYVTDTALTDNVEKLSAGKYSQRTFSQLFHQFSLRSNIDCDLLISNTAGNTLYSSFETSELTKHLKMFDRTVHKHMTESMNTNVYNTVYYLYEPNPRYLFARNIYDSHGVVTGWISLYLDGGNWNELLRKSQVDTIITTTNGSVIASSDRTLINGLNKFKPQGHFTFSCDDRQYWIASRYDALHNINLYAYATDNSYQTYIPLGLFLVLLIGILTTLLSKRLSRKIADIHSASLTKLAKEIVIISQDSDHRIEMGTNDEFSGIAQQINTMLDSIESLSKRNLALSELNNQIEIRQLKAQFDPHFLYNTLECIRYAIRSNPEVADKMIIKVTKLLRYSINGQGEDVPLSQDIDFIKDYLEIIHFRFQDRISYSFEIAEDCINRRIPRLLLQTIIENCVKYGLRGKKCIHILVSCAVFPDGTLRFLVSDDGIGMDKGKLDEIRSMLEAPEGDGIHMGLYNIVRSLKLRYGDDAHFAIDSVYGEGTTVTILIQQRGNP